MNHYSLIHRFRGTLLGALIGEKIVASNDLLGDWSPLKEQIFLKLLEKGTISPQDWQAIAPESLALTAREWLVATLPLILLFHDEPSLFWEQLDPLILQHRIPSSTLETLAIGLEIFRLILSGNLSNHDQQNLVGNLAQIPQSCHQSLSHLQTALDSGMPLTEIKKRWQTTKAGQQSLIAIALYCFHRTPNYFRLSIAQAAQLGDSATVALTGALSGAYNGELGIPRHWRLSLAKRQNLGLFHQQTLTLWTIWAGLDNFGLIQPNVDNPPTVSASSYPKTPSLRLIS